MIRNFRYVKYLSGIRLAFGCVLLWVFITYSGRRLPYIYTELSDHLRVFGLFPLLLGLMVYFGFIYHKSGEATGYRQSMNKLPVGKERVKATAWGLFGLLLISGGLAWTSTAFPAWATNLFATERYAYEYSIADITKRNGPVWSALFDLQLIGAEGDEVTLRLNRIRYERNRWKTGERICVLGRTSVFGTIIDDTTRQLSRCGRGTE